jgi:hypothetical protein
MPYPRPWLAFVSTAGLVAVRGPGALLVLGDPCEQEVGEGHALLPFSIKAER